jgi:hypothetical protein
LRRRDGELVSIGELAELSVGSFGVTLSFSGEMPVEDYIVSAEQYMECSLHTFAALPRILIWRSARVGTIGVMSFAKLVDFACAVVSRGVIAGFNLAVIVRNTHILVLTCHA